MRTSHFIASLRRSRRVVAAAILPAFGWWALSGAACFAAPLDGAAGRHPVPTAGHEHASATADHGSLNASHEHAREADCPHCPPAADEGSSTPALCMTEGTPNANGAGTSASPDLAKLFTHPRPAALPRIGAAPPPIRSIAYRASPLPHTPLNIRHCVFLI